MFGNFHHQHQRVNTDSFRTTNLPRCRLQPTTRPFTTRRTLWDTAAIQSSELCLKFSSGSTKLKDLNIIFLISWRCGCTAKQCWASPDRVPGLHSQMSLMHFDHRSGQFVPSYSRKVVSSFLMWTNRGTSKFLSSWVTMSGHRTFSAYTLI